MRNLRSSVQSQARAPDNMRGASVPDKKSTANKGGLRLASRSAGPKPGEVCALVSSPARWEITDHAVARYRQRCPGKRAVSLAQAVSELTELSVKAHFVKMLESGLELWRGGKPWRLRFRVSRSVPGLPQLVTVLAGCDRVSHGKKNQRHEGRQGWN